MEVSESSEDESQRVVQSNAEHHFLHIVVVEEPVQGENLTEMRKQSDSSVLPSKLELFVLVC